MKCVKISCTRSAEVRCEMGMWLCEIHFNKYCNGKRWEEGKITSPAEELERRLNIYYSYKN